MGRPLWGTNELDLIHFFAVLASGVLLMSAFIALGAAGVMPYMLWGGAGYVLAFILSAVASGIALDLIRGRPNRQAQQDDEEPDEERVWQMRAFLKDMGWTPRDASERALDRRR